VVELALKCPLEHEMRVGVSHDLTFPCVLEYAVHVPSASRVNGDYTTPEAGRIAVVGNGPLSTYVRGKIRTFDVVARFNKMDNFEPGEPVTLLYLRFNEDAMAFYGLEMALQFCAPTVALVYERKHAESAKRAGNLLIDRMVLDVYEEFEGIPYPGDHLPYPPYSNKERRVPSTGFFGLHHVMKIYRSATVHLFGFTWHGWKWHDWDYEKRQIMHYAKEGRVVVHSE
jgi:hypothetical protein